MAQRPFPGARLVRALLAAARRQILHEWRGSPPHLALLGARAARGFAASPKDLRPPNLERGERLLAGDYAFAGCAMTLATGEDPWNRATPDRRFAVALHRFDWLRDLIALGSEGEAEALRLVLEWRRLFGRWNSFSWSAEVLERRVFNLACALPVLARGASDAEAAGFAADLARQARQLRAMMAEDPARTAERAAVVALAGAALADPAGEPLRLAGLARLAKALPSAVQPDGVHASRSPEAGLDLLFDLLTLDKALVQLGQPAPEPMARAIDRLSRGVRFLTLPDGTLAPFQGGSRRPAADVAAALAHEESAAPPEGVHPLGGYQRIAAGVLTLIVDAAPPAAGAFGATACGQPLAFALACGQDVMAINTGWAPGAAAPQALRLTDGGSTLSVADASAGAPLAGFLARALGPLLVNAPGEVTARRHDSGQGVWLDLAHDGWVAGFGLQHERRLFLDVAAGELRGEEGLTPLKPAADGPRRYTPFAVRFHLPAEVKASLARDQKSVLLSGPSGVGWWLRNDALEVSIEGSVEVVGDETRRTRQVVLKGRARADHGGRIRWKLAPSSP